MHKLISADEVRRCRWRSNDGGSINSSATRSVTAFCLDINFDQVFVYNMAGSMSCSISPFNLKTAMVDPPLRHKLPSTIVYSRVSRSAQSTLDEMKTGHRYRRPAARML